MGLSCTFSNRSNPTGVKAVDMGQYFDAEVYNIFCEISLDLGAEIADGRGIRSRNI